MPREFLPEVQRVATIQAIPELMTAASIPVMRQFKVGIALSDVVNKGTALAIFVDGEVRGQSKENAAAFQSRLQGYIEQLDEAIKYTEELGVSEDSITYLLSWQIRD